jgi:hypothetical protein
MSFHVPQHYLHKHPVLGLGDGNNGFFLFERNGITFRVIASDGAGWEHVSVSLNKKRCPTWDEMCLVKNMFWDDEDCVLQFHPKKSEYVNNHPYVLHLWRPIGISFPIPSSLLVGI